jgi:Fe-S cluster assembly protein SufD
MTPTLASEKSGFLSSVEELARLRAGKDPAWLEVLRNEATAEIGHLGFPTTRDEEWKYTNLAPVFKLPLRHSQELDVSETTIQRVSPFTFVEGQQSLLVFVNGRFAAKLSNLTGIPAGVTAGNISDLATRERGVLHEHLGAYASFRESALTAVNTAMIADGALIHFATGVIVDAPIHVLYVSSPTEQSNSSYPRTLRHC